MVMVCSCARNLAPNRYQSGLNGYKRSIVCKADRGNHGKGASNVNKRRLQLLGSIAGVAMSLGAAVGGK